MQQQKSTRATLRHFFYHIPYMSVCRHKSNKSLNVVFFLPTRKSMMPCQSRFFIVFECTAYNVTYSRSKWCELTDNYLFLVVVIIRFFILGHMNNEVFCVLCALTTVMT